MILLILIIGCTAPRVQNVEVLRYRVAEYQNKRAIEMANSINLLLAPPDSPPSNVHIPIQGTLNRLSFLRKMDAPAFYQSDFYLFKYDGSSGHAVSVVAVVTEVDTVIIGDFEVGLNNIMEHEGTIDSRSLMELIPFWVELRSPLRDWTKLVDTQHLLDKMIQEDRSNTLKTTLQLPEVIESKTSLVAEYCFIYNGNVFHETVTIEGDSITFHKMLIGKYGKSILLI